MRRRSPNTAARFLVRGGKHVVAARQGAGAQRRDRVSRLRDRARLPRFRGIPRGRQASRRRPAPSTSSSPKAMTARSRADAIRENVNGRDEAHRQRRRRPHGTHGHPDDPRVGRARADRRARAPGLALARRRIRRRWRAARRAALRSSPTRCRSCSTPTRSSISPRPPRASSSPALAAQARIADVIGTTGLSDDDLDRIDAAARHAPIVRSGNMSLGVNLLAALTRRAASALGPDFDIEIVEMHHRMKVDAPSGTALLLGEAAADGRGMSLKDHSARGRDGLTGARRKGDIGFASLRGGHDRRRSQRHLRRRGRAGASQPPRRGSGGVRPRRAARGAMGERAASPGSIRWRTCWASAAIERRPAPRVTSRRALPCRKIRASPSSASCRHGPGWRAACTSPLPGTPPCARCRRGRR